MGNKANKQSLLEKILATEPRVKQHSRIASSNADEDIFALQRKGVVGLLADNPTLHQREAAPFQQRLTVAAATLMRQFRQRRQRALSPPPQQKEKVYVPGVKGQRWLGYFHPTGALSVNRAISVPQLHQRLT